MKTDSLGFTGSRLGMTPKQILRVRDMLPTKRITEVHHGCCVGADADFHWLVRRHDSDIQITGHRSTFYSKTDQRVVQSCDVIKDPLGPLNRNMEIVNSSDWLIAAPKEHAEILRSGTWATVRRARKANIPICIIWPDGTVKWENTDDS